MFMSAEALAKADRTIRRKGRFRGTSMDFAYSEEQNLLRNSVVRMLADTYSFETFKKVSRGEPGGSSAFRKTIAP